MKKIVGLILSLMMILALLPTVVAKADEYTDSNGIKYTIDPSTHTAIVAGYEGSPVDIVIPGTLTVGADDYTVTEIGSRAFRECQSLKSVTISNGITTIRDRAFSWCPNLTSVTIPDSVVTIEGYAFYSSTSLSDIVIPNSVTTIGVEAFSNCSGLKSINIPASVTNMAQSVFKLCTGLEEVVLSDGVTTIPYNTFNMCYGLTSITIPASVTSIEMDAFNDCAGLTTVTFLEESKVTTIGEFAFYMCSSLASIEIPEGVSQIGDNTFYGDDLLASITILSPEIAFSETLALPDGFQLNGKTVKQNQDSNEHGKTSLTISKEGVVTVNVTPDERYELDDLKYYCFDDSTRITDQTFTVPDGDFEVFARFKDKTYTVKFVNDDENHTELQSGNVRFGETPQYKGETPTKEADAQYTYTFRGWTDGTKTYGKDETLPAVDGDVTYTAVYDDKINVYSIRFVDEDGTVIKDGVMLYGETPEYGLDETPAKEADAQYTYTFSGWTDGTETYGKDETLPSVKGDVTYTAVYDKTVNKYDLTFDLGGGTLNGKTGTYTMNCEYGAKINLPDAPTKEGYKFLYWKGSEYEAGAEYTVEGPHDFTAEWEEVKEEQETKQDTSPKTGDNGNAGIWAAIMGGALLVIILLVLLGRKYLKKQR